LPNALGFVDPLHSTGLAHTISGVDRVTDAFIKFRDSPEQLSENLSTYRTDVLSELSWVDDLICGCYQRLDNFSAFSSFAMCYFAAATTFERRFLANSSFSSGDYSEISQTTVMADQPVGPRFLCSGDKDLQQSVQALLARDPSEASTEFERACRDAVAPFNHVGLFAPAIRNMYAYTALP
jgi:FADH2 O2-dependent halogenase